MSDHYIKKCIYCKKIVNQCRCMAKDKVLEEVICKECLHGGLDKAFLKLPDKDRQRLLEGEWIDEHEDKTTEDFAVWPPEDEAA